MLKRGHMISLFKACISVCSFFLDSFAYFCLIWLNHISNPREYLVQGLIFVVISNISSISSIMIPSYSILILDDESGSQIFKRRATSLTTFISGAGTLRCADLSLNSSWTSQSHGLPVVASEHIGPIIAENWFSFRSTEPALCGWWRFLLILFANCLSHSQGSVKKLEPGTIQLRPEVFNEGTRGISKLIFQRVKDIFCQHGRPNGMP